MKPLTQDMEVFIIVLWLAPPKSNRSNFL